MANEAIDIDLVSQRVMQIALQLGQITDSQLDQPTSDDRALLMKIRRTVKDMQELDGLDEQAETDLAYLNILMVRMANRQEAFWEQNGEKWADE